MPRPKTLSPTRTSVRADEFGLHGSALHQPCIFRESFNSAFDLIFLLNRHGIVLDVNRTALKQRNLKASKVVGSPLWLTPWWDISPDAQIRLKATIRDAARDQLARYEVDLLGPDGGVCSYDVSVKSIKGEFSGRRYLLCAARDITERKRVERALITAREDLEFRVQSRTDEFAAANSQLQAAVEQRQQMEKELRQSEAKIQAMLHTAADAIITINDRGIMNSFNPAAERMFGYQADEVIGRNVKMLMPDPYHSEHDQYLEHYQRTGKAKIIGIGREVVGRRKDGLTFPLDLAISEVRLGDQRIYTGIIRDITERKRLEREILEISDQEQLRIGQDLHDGVGQQLTGVAFLAKVLGEELAAEKSPRAASAKKITRLVQEAISKTRDLARGLSPVGLEAQGLTEALQELARHTDEVLGIHCDFVNSRPVEPVDAAANVHLYRITQESVNNAIKHGRAKHLCIRLGNSDGKGLLIIEDDGIGVEEQPPEKQGMGLRIMAYRARMIGASLTVRPGDSAGTVVTCLFPMILRKRRESPNALKKRPNRRTNSRKNPSGR